MGLEQRIKKLEQRAGEERPRVVVVWDNTPPRPGDRVITWREDGTVESRVVREGEND